MSISLLVESTGGKVRGPTIESCNPIRSADRSLSIGICRKSGNINCPVRMKWNWTLFAAALSIDWLLDSCDDDLPSATLTEGVGVLLIVHCSISPLSTLHNSRRVD